MSEKLSTKNLLRELCAVRGFAGREHAAVQVAQRFLEPLGACRVTPLNSLLCEVRKPVEGKPHILLDAHIDEIGMIITSITDEGFLKVSGCGGINRRLLAGSQVTVYSDPPVKAFVCSVPPHLRDQVEDLKKVPKLETYALDAGFFSKEEALKHVKPGDRASLDGDFVELLGGLVSSRALDDRAGAACVIRAAEKIAEIKPDCGVTVCLSSMEEVGGQGAATAAEAVRPTHAIVVDVSFAHCPEVPKYKTTALGSGPMIGFAPILNGDLSRKLATFAEQHGIPHTPEIMNGKTGTNADEIAVSGFGVKTVTVSIPQRNMHSPVEVVSPEDIENAARLIAEFIGGKGLE